MERLYARRQSRPHRAALGAVASARASLRARRPCRVGVRGDYWVHRHGDVALVTPGYWTPSPEQLDRTVRDGLCYQYDPAPGDLVIDVGAGIGEVTRTLARLVEPGGRVIAIEAHPRTLGALELMLSLNGIENVETIGAAAMDAPGSVEISDGSEWEANTLLASDGPGRHLRVRAVTLDEVVRSRDLGEIALLKLNIEGAEVKALAGMTETLRRCRHVVVECHDFLAERTGEDGFRTLERVSALLGEHGFAIARRPDHPSPWTRDTVYARNLSPPS